MSKKPKRQVLKEQKLNTILLESYTDKKSEFAGSPVIGSFKVNITEEGVLNANGRKYPSEVWSQPNSFAKGGKYLDKSGKLRPLSLLGYLDHPVDNQLEVLLEESAIVWSSLTLNENTWSGEAHILDTPKGKIVKTFLDYAKIFGGGEQIGVSTRADGTTSIVESAGEVYEQVDADGFYLAAIDFVYNPSVFSANNPTLLESKKRQKTLLESIQALADDDLEHKEVYLKFIKDLKEDLNEAASLEKAKQIYLQSLKEQEYKLHQAIYEIDKMTDEEFIDAEISENLNRDEFLKKIKKEYKSLVSEIEKEEGILESMSKKEIKKLLTEADDQEVIDELEDRADEVEDEIEEIEVEDDVEEIEDKVDEVEEEIEEEVDTEEEIEEEPEVSIDEVFKAVNDLTVKVDSILDWLFDIDDTMFELEVEAEEGNEEVEEEVNEEAFDDFDGLELTDEDLELMTDEELEALYELAELSINGF